MAAYLRNWSSRRKAALCRLSLFIPAEIWLNLRQISTRLPFGTGASKGVSVRAGDSLCSLSISSKLFAPWEVNDRPNRICFSVKQCICVPRKSKRRWKLCRGRNGFGENGLLIKTISAWGYSLAIFTIRRNGSWIRSSVQNAYRRTKRRKRRRSM